MDAARVARAHVIGVDRVGCDEFPPRQLVVSLSTWDAVASLSRRSAGAPDGGRRVS